jgi:hypothetical protein
LKAAGIWTTGFAYFGAKLHPANRTKHPSATGRHLINTGGRASARFNVGKPVDFRLEFDRRKLKRRERCAPFVICEMGSTVMLVSVLSSEIVVIIEWLIATP